MHEYILLPFGIYVLPVLSGFAVCKFLILPATSLTNVRKKLLICIVGGLTLWLLVNDIIIMIAYAGVYSPMDLSSKMLIRPFFEIILPVISGILVYRFLISTSFADFFKKLLICVASCAVLWVIVYDLVYIFFIEVLSYREVMDISRLAPGDSFSIFRFTLLFILCNIISTITAFLVTISREYQGPIRVRQNAADRR